MLCLLGAPAVRVGELYRPLQLRPKAVALLARVALDRPVQRSELAGEIFGEAEDPRAALRWHLSYLRKHLPGPLQRCLAVSPQRVAFEGATDVEDFQRAAHRVIEQPDAPAVSHVLGLYRGDLCAGLRVTASPTFDTWLYVEQERLRRLFRQATVAATRQALADSDAARVIEPLTRLVSVDPYYEEGHCLLIDVAESLGQRQAAATAYQRYQRMLRHELRTEPPLSMTQRFEPETPGRTPPRDNLVALRELTLHVVDWPGGEPTILAIHGSTMSAYTFTALAERLAPDVRFVAVDLRGHGFSDKPPTGYTVDQHAEDVRELMGELALHRPVVLGFSIGGAIAAFVASHGGCAGLILLEAVIGDQAFTENAAATVAMPMTTQLQQRFGGFDEYMTRWRTQQQQYSDEAERVLERTIRYELAPLPDGTYRRRALMAAFEETWTSLLAFDSLATLARVRCPTLIVHAPRPWIDGRPYLSDAIIAAQRKAVPHAQLFVARQSNHPTMIRDPESAMVEALRSFTLSCR